MSSQRKFTFAISSPDEFLVILVTNISLVHPTAGISHIERAQRDMMVIVCECFVCTRTMLRSARISVFQVCVTHTGCVNFGMLCVRAEYRPCSSSMQ